MLVGGLPHDCLSSSGIKSKKKSEIIVGWKKTDQYTFMYVEVSSELFQSIAQVVLLTIFPNLNDVRRSIVFYLYISRVMWSPLLMIRSGDLNVVLQCYISFHNRKLDHLVRWIKFALLFSDNVSHSYPINMEYCLKGVYGCASRQTGRGLKSKMPRN